MLEKVGSNVIISKNPSEILLADKLILPGVGHYDYGMKMLNQSGLREVLDHSVLNLRKPVLGICLGAQLLGYGSEEGSLRGLGWIDMYCKKLPLDAGIRVPHMGWNQVAIRRKSPLFSNSQDDHRYYFVHSYYMECASADQVIGTTNYGIEFTCVVQKENIFGTQFHPEKSLRYGKNLMQAFSNYQPS